MAIPVAIYVIVICTMMWRSAVRIHKGSVVLSSEWIGIVGEVLFTISDTILAVNKLRAAIPSAAYIIIIFYWLGQMGVTSSAKYYIQSGI